MFHGQQEKKKGGEKKKTNVLLDYSIYVYVVLRMSVDPLALDMKRKKSSSSS
jgi:hypothetical protein